MRCCCPRDACADKDDPRQVIIESVDLLPQDRDPIVLKMGNDKEIKELAAARYIMLAFALPHPCQGRTGRSFHTHSSHATPGHTEWS